MEKPTMAIITEEMPATTVSAPLVVTFKVGRQLYALPLSAVLQVVRLPALTMVPGAPAGMCGLLNLRGVFVPVLDARSLLGEVASVGMESQVIILSAGFAGAPEAGLLVDAVDTVRHYPPGSFAGISSGDALVVGMLRDRVESAVVLDPEALVARAGRGY
jgi:purine-binding chemotaxis protein CheW